MAQLKHPWQSEHVDYSIIKHVVHTINISDFDDPDLVVAAPIYEWQQTNAGKWIMEHSNPAPSWHRCSDQATYQYKYRIVAYLSPKDYTYWKLKYD